MRSCLLLILLWCVNVQASSFNILEETADGLLIDFVMPASALTVTGGGHQQEMVLAGTVPRLRHPGLPALPFFAELLAVPPGATASMEVVGEERFRDYEGVDYAVFQADDPTGNSGAPLSYEPGVLWPRPRATLEYVGILRGVRAYALRLYPIAHNAQTRTLRVYQRITLAIRFESLSSPSSHGKRLSTTIRRSASAPLYAPFLNSPRPDRTSIAVTAKPTQGEIDGGWYDPTKKWLKVLVEEENIHKIDRVWFERRLLDVDSMDPRTLRMFLDGEEQSLYVEGEEDGSFDAADFLLFFGRERNFRDAEGVERDHDSIYGRKNTYWLTWGGDAGKRFASRSGAPVNDFPVSEWYWASSHFEFDEWFDQLEFAVDNEGDHWFERKIEARDAGKIASTVVTGEIFSPFLEEEYLARLRVALHGWSHLGHRTVVKFNQQVINETIWEGQIELVVDEDIPSSYINEDESTNRLTVQVRADQAPFDLVYYNWFELQYRRRYDAFPGHIALPETPSTGRRITLRKFAHPNITLFDLSADVRITDALVEQSPDDRYVATFEDAPSHEPFYVAADSLNMPVPRGFVDIASDWRSPANGADYLIITHDLFVNASNRLADHRGQSGLDVEVVNVTDIYDEFSGGQMDRAAIADFIQYTYDNWQPVPTYVLLMGDATYDYRNIIGGGRPSFVPSQYYQARERGHSPSDYLYTLVDGDDLLPDLALGRLPVESTEQADRTVDRVIRYDTDPEVGDWRSRVIYLANHHARGIFSEPSDALAENYTQPFGLESVKIYNPDNSDVPNATGGAYLEALNAGALLVNFAGHGSADFMQFVFALTSDWDYLGRVNNGRQLPLVLALSCLNGNFVNPKVYSVGQVFTTMKDGGAIAYVSASAISFVSQNDLLSDNIYRQIFEDGVLTFGPTLNAAKVSVLAAHSSWVEAAVTMQLFGDPAQDLALPLDPDYTPLSLRPRSTPLLHGSSTEIELVMHNNTRRTADSLDVLLLGYSDSGAPPDTIAQLVNPGFVGSHTLTLDWVVNARGEVYRMEAVLDATQSVTEVDESNNVLSVEVEILEPIVATLLYPAEGALVASPEFTLEALVPLASDGGETYAVEFLLGTEHELNAESALLSSMPMLAEGGIASYSPAAYLPSLSPPTDYFWRARVVDGITAGPWSGSQGFTLVAEEIPDSSPANERLWRQQGSQLLTGETHNLVLNDSHQLRTSTAWLSAHPDATQREDDFTVAGLDGTGIVCSDGTYLYAKRWFNDGSTVYPGVDQFARIGTGFNGTEAGRLYGFLPGQVSAGISATYHSDGFIYNENGNAFELERLSTETGLLDTVAVPDGLLEWRSGLVDGLANPKDVPHFLITSDGRYIYNVSMSSALGVRTEWGVRVIDPADGWRLVREFTSPPTETGFTYMWTDGLLADGERIYLIEFDGGYRIRMIDAFDGRFLDEWVSEQETTRSVAGQYDWVNNKIWLGDLWGSDFYRYTGLSQLTSGALTTDPVGPAHAWSNLEIEGMSSSGGLRVDVLGWEDSSEGRWRPLDGYEDLETQSVDLGGLDATRYPLLRLRATLRDFGEPAPALTALQLRFAASPSLRVAAVDHRDDDAGLHAQVTVRNLSPFTIDDARVVARTESGTELAAALVPSLTRGQTRVVVLDSIPIPAVGQRLFAGVETPIADADPIDNVLEIEFREGPIAAIAFTIWPEGGVFVSGDPVRAEQGILIAPPVDVGRGELRLAVDGQEVSADSSYDDGSILYRPGPAKGDHVLRVAFISEEQSGEQYESEIRLVVAEGLTLANPLVYPHPVTGPAGFTYVLSHDAEVIVELFSLNGRLIRRLGPQLVSAGFSETKWDGRGNDGRQLANGTYLCRIRARDEAGSAVEHRAPFVITR